METVTSSARSRERTAMQRFGDGGMMLLPWTKQILGVLWEHLRLLVQLICYSLMTVFQMFRFEVHLRITDDNGEHIQHMTTGSGDTTDSFLSLFDNKNVMVAGQNPLSNPFDLNSHSRSVLSSLVNDELCCSLVDDFVSRATECLSENDDLYIGEHCSWNHGFDWNLLTGSERRYTEDMCPVPFSACVSSLYQKDIEKHDDSCTELYCNFSSSPIEDRRQELGGQSSDSEISWGGSDSSCVEGDKEESDRLWDLLTRSTDPYHPLHFTACISSGIAGQQRGFRASQKSPVYTTSQTSVSSCSDAGEQGNTGAFSSEDEEEALWKSLSLDDDPYHPLNFRAPLHSLAVNGTHGHADEPDCHKQSKITRDSTVARGTKPPLLSRVVVSHQCPQLSAEKPSKVPWKRPINKIDEANSKKETASVKKVRFSPVVQVHKMWAWSYALQASRKGPWEEYARDRDRFQRRIMEAEQAIGYCFNLSHRKNVSAYQQRTLNNNHSSIS
ncbi:protein phosphatase 1 regulatory subunit 15B [Electrophorus electricus]|uniref:protein phosphatase 1 regulatory subunit 15B n=1 Tax=Electrophorus electricus TaxID=8005 RepID=UPI0015D0BA4C|nr:protein phosphatase 1 regulatory subunit 15B [Electrophorus electricus]